MHKWSHLHIVDHLLQVEEEEADLANEATLTRINSFLEEALQSSCEGIMVKSLDHDAEYSPSKRSDSWLKVLITNRFK